MYRISKRQMKLSYRNYPILMMMDKKMCADLEIGSRTPSVTDMEMKGFVERCINKGALCGIPIYYVSKEFEKAYTENWDKLSDLLINNESIAQECLENCVMIMPSGNVFINIMAEDKFMFICALKNGAIGNARYGTWNTARYMETDDDNVKQLRQKMFGFLIVLAFKKFATVELDIVAPFKKKKTVLDPQGKVVNDTGVEVTLLDSRWFREIIREEGFKVRGHFRLQPCKDEQGYWTRKLIYINEYEKHGYHRKAKMEVQPISNNIPSA